MWEAIGSFFSGLFSGVWQSILGAFGLSTDQKLGRLEVKEADDKATSKKQTAIDAIAINGESDKDVDDRLGKGNA